MSSNGSTPTWHVPDDPAATIEKGLSAGVERDRIVSLLAEREFDHLPERRTEAIVRATPDSGAEDELDLLLSQPPAVDNTPRDPRPRSVAVRDLEYLSRREAARVIGLALEQFDGNTVRPAADEATEVDLFWRRQHATVGIRTVPVVDGLIDVDHVTAVVDGPLRTDAVQTPSEVAVVTNSQFTDTAVNTASDHGVRLFDGGHVRAWFRRARLPLSSAGTVLENGEDHDGPLTELVDVDPVPPRREIDPLAIERARAVVSFDEEAGRVPVQRSAGEEPTDGDAERGSEPADRGSPDVQQPPPGQTGTLYTDAEEDVDSEVFDEFLEGL